MTYFMIVDSTGAVKYHFEGWRVWHKKEMSLEIKDCKKNTSDILKGPFVKRNYYVSN